jgi:hypothetical protein
MNESAAPWKSLMWWCATSIVLDKEGFFDEINGSVDFFEERYERKTRDSFQSRQAS